MCTYMLISSCVHNIFTFIGLYVTEAVHSQASMHNLVLLLKDWRVLLMDDLCHADEPAGVETCPPY